MIHKRNAPALTTVDAVEVSFNSFESPDESAKAVFSEFSDDSITTIVR